MASALTLRGVSTTFQRGDHRLHVLRDVSIDIAAGEVVSVIAGREHGKTTLLKVAAGLERPDQGEVFVGEHELTRLSDRRRARLLGGEIGWVGRGGPGLGIKILDYVSAPLVMGHRSGRRQAMAAAWEALERVDGGGCANLRWSDLSNWERVLVGLAQGIAAGPRLLLIDDVFDGLGLLRTQDAGTLVCALAADLGCGVLMGVSDAEVALSSSQRLFSLNKGRLVAMGGTAGERSNVIAFPGDMAASVRGQKHAPPPESSA